MRPLGPGDYFELLPSAGCQADLALVQDRPAPDIGWSNSMAFCGIVVAFFFPPAKPRGDSG